MLGVLPLSELKEQREDSHPQTPRTTSNAGTRCCFCTGQSLSLLLYSIVYGINQERNVFTQTRQLYISIFTILKESYTSLQALYAGQYQSGTLATKHLSAGYPPGEEPTWASMTRLGCPSLGLSSGKQPAYEDPLGPILIRISSKWQASITSLIKIQCAY